MSLRSKSIIYSRVYSILNGRLQNWTFQRSLQFKKKAINRTISEVEHKGSEKEIDKNTMRNMVRERESIERKLSTTYSLGRDMTHSQSKSLLPLYKQKAKAKASSFVKESNVAAMFHTLSETSSSIESSSEGMEEDSSRSVSERRSSSESLVSSHGEEGICTELVAAHG